MSGRLCCYKQQQHFKLLVQFVFKVSAFHFSTRTKMHAPLPNCRSNNTLIHASQAVRIRRHYTVKAVSNVGAALSCLVV